MLFLGSASSLGGSKKFQRVATNYLAQLPLVGGKVPRVATFDGAAGKEAAAIDGVD